jgi:hypothetical protein
MCINAIALPATRSVDLSKARKSRFPEDVVVTAVVCINVAKIAGGEAAGTFET